MHYSRMSAQMYIGLRRERNREEGMSIFMREKTDGGLAGGEKGGGKSNLRLGEYR